MPGCSSGVRSVGDPSRRRRYWSRRGYQDVANVRGGFGGARDPVSGQVVDEGWSMAGLPVEAGAPPGGSYEDLRKKLT